ncbi:hypothetical protein B0H17DRAFT_1218378 [Mycena rosella]|uniref:Uncharacterized protein n=1 Tax=Mycena rosella TaxID=1033263 RepID=A0AAD7FM24_MYCRO|nr:hypothetical protein B0H17DRAFT_1218378 [Mycena rosella]
MHSDNGGTRIAGVIVRPSLPPYTVLALRPRPLCVHIATDTHPTHPTACRACREARACARAARGVLPSDADLRSRDAERGAAVREKARALLPPSHPYLRSRAAPPRRCEDAA